jgi:hypothetical protein
MVGGSSANPALQRGQQSSRHHVDVKHHRIRLPIVQDIKGEQLFWANLPPGTT